MTKRTRRNHSPAFKAKVALAAVKGEKPASASTLNSVAEAGGVPVVRCDLALLRQPSLRTRPLKSRLPSSTPFIRKMS